MTVASVYSLAPAKFGSTVIPVERVGVAHGLIDDPHRHSGNEYPTLVRVPGANPRITMTVPFAIAYAQIGLGITEFSAFEVYFAKFANSIRSSSSVHSKYALASSATAVAQITGFSVNVDGTVMAEVEVALLSSNGSTHPLIRTDSNAMPTLASQPVLHTLGPVTINGTTITGLAATNGQLQPNLDVRRSDGDPYPRVAARLEGAPRLSLDHADPVAALSAISAAGVGITSNVIAYFRRFNPTTGLVDTSGGNDISITIASGRVHPVDLESEQGSVSRLGIEVIGLSTSSTSPFAISTSATAPQDA